MIVGRINQPLGAHENLLIYRVARFDAARCGFDPMRQGFREPRLRS
jgi:hypothetical protein